MFFDSFAEFIAMGKHGFYVWFCYGITALVIIANILAPIRQRKKLIEQQARLQRREKKNASAA
ncbi:MAG: heme exporter protein D [Oleispira sp.]|jgi:heme exporter protein D